MFSDRTKNKTNATIWLILSIGITVLINLISVKKFYRIDLTEDRVYTLSESSKNIMKKLDDHLIVKAFFSKDLPPPYNNYVRYLKDQLNEFKAYSRGNFNYEFIDPAGDPDKEKEIVMMGVPPVQLTDIKSDKFEIKKGFMGLAILFEDRKEIIPIIKSTNGLEYDIISKIKKITQKEIKKIGFLSGHGEPDLKKDMETAVTLLQQQYVVESVDIKDGNPIDENLDSLIIAGSKEWISEKEKYQIDQFLMKGKTLGFLLDTVDIEPGTFRVQQIDNNIFDLVEHYGVKINKDLLLDSYNKRIQVQQKRGFMIINNIVDYPFIPVVRDMDKDNPIVSKLEGIFLPFVSTLTLKKEKKEGIMSKSLLRSSNKSWIQAGGSYNTNPLQRFRFDDSKKGPHTVAAVVSGKFSSFYTDKEIPTNEETDKSEEPIKEGSPLKKDTPLFTSTNTRIIVVGDSDFIKEGMFQDRMNVPFVLNLVDWLLQDEELISIRSRGVTDRPMKELSDMSRQAIKYANIFGISFIFIIFGLIRWKIRRLKKRETVI